MLFIWPKVITIETVLANLEFQYKQFAVDGSVLVYTATCSLEEFKDVRMASKDSLHLNSNVT